MHQAPDQGAGRRPLVWIEVKALLNEGPHSLRGEWEEAAWHFSMSVPRDRWAMQDIQIQIQLHYKQGSRS